MTHLENTSVSELREALDDAEEVRATKRLMVAIAYKQGVTQTDLAEWYGLSRKTVYNWLRRFEEDAIRSAASDESRPGRPPKLGPEERAEVRQLLAESPENAGYDAEEWSSPLVQRLLEERFGVEYSRTSAYRILTQDG
ncbi:helix-turn-helix domain-containing protein [Haladaptatus salinisoli]|uniref:helix-turn-helix domain-containing protein n=1 Tax=Haladaptatus salinisoli TaxID=2884876 RepID=UPI001D0A14F1|nr:helix-turn-helix domain-containing protein [Haladaptatus salinisoli]